MARPGQWAVRTPGSITYGSSEDWAWQTAEAAAQRPGAEWVQILPPLERWDEWPSDIPGSGIGLGLGIAGVILALAIIAIALRTTS